MKRTIRKRSDPVAYPSLLQWCGVSGILGAGLFVAWGYLHGPATSPVLRSAVVGLAFTVPALFFSVVVGLCLLWGSSLGKLRWLVMALAGYALGWGLVGAGAGSEAVWAYFAQRGWPHYLSDWLLFMLTGLTLLGIGMVSSRGPRRLTGAVTLATGASGWIYDLTDSGAVLEARWVHIGFGLLFGLGWAALGTVLLATSTMRSRRPLTRG